MINLYLTSMRIAILFWKPSWKRFHLRTEIRSSQFMTARLIKVDNLKTPNTSKNFAFKRRKLTDTEPLIASGT